MAKRKTKAAADNSGKDPQNEMKQNLADLRKQIADSLSGLATLGRGLSGFNSSLDQAARLMLDLASDGTVLVKNISEIIRTVDEVKALKSAASKSGEAGKGNTGEDISGAVGGAAGAAAAASSASKGGSVFGAVLGGLGAGVSLVSGIFGIFKRRKEEEKKYRREMQAALNDQLTAEIALSLATSRRLADEQAITREKYKQIESGLKKASGNRQDVLSDIDADMQEMYEKLNGRYSSRYKRGVTNYYNALRDLKNHKDDLDWLETVGGSPLITQSDDAYKRYQALYERLLKIAQQEKEWKDQQKGLADDLIGSSAQSLSDSWVEAFRKGEEATWDFAKNFEDVMRQAIINGFSDSVIMAQMDPIFNKFREKVMDYLAGELELDEVVTPDLEKQVEETSEKIKKLSPELRNILGKLGLEVGNSGSETLSAAIKGVSEQTASLVAGQMNAIRTNQVQSMDTLSESLSSLVAIEANTRYNRYLESIDRRLGAADACGSLRAAGLS